MVLPRDSFAPATLTTSIWPPRLPSWTWSRTHDISESDAAFAAGIALKSLDNLVHCDPPWLGSWRSRCPKSAAVAAGMLGRSEDENAIRDAVLLTAAGDDPCPAGKLFLATRMLAHRSGTITTPFVTDLAALLEMRWDGYSILQISPGEQQPSRSRT
jgi:hypothetical protein